MLQSRIRQHQQALQLEQMIAVMPEYPIYRQSSNRYVVYVGGRRYVLATSEALDCASSRRAPNGYAQPPARSKQLVHSYLEALEISPP
jgi:hypothetical protein